MKRISLLLVFATLFIWLQGQRSYEMYENFHIPRFYPEKFFMYNTDTTTNFMRSNNSGFEWGAYSPVVTTAWGPIGYLYSDVLDHIRNALCFTSAAEYPGSYAYCQFDSPENPGINDSLIGLSKVTIKFQVNGPDDKIGLMIRDANGEWFFSKSEHGILAAGSEISFTDVDQYAWMKVKDSISDNLNTHAHIENGLGDIREGAVAGSPDLSFIIGAGILLHEAALSDLSLRIEDILWEGKTPDNLPSLIQPGNNSILHIMSTTLKWNYSLDDIVSFNVWLKRDNEAYELAGDSIDSHELEIADLVDQSTYTWRVDVINSEGEIQQGLEWSFETKKGMSSFFNEMHTTKIASTATIEWTNVGPGMSGYCDEYFFHPSDPNYMFMNLDMGNCYYTDDNGQSWITTKDWDTDGEIPRFVWVEFSRQNPDFGMALDDKGYILTTTNRGKRWTRGKSLSKKHSVITVDPNNDSNWYVGAGQFWRVKFIHRSQDNLHGTQYRNTEYGHIWITKDKGNTWTQITDNFNSNLDVAKIFVDPEDSEKVYAFTNYGFYKSIDGGMHWNLKGDGLPHNLPRDGAFYYNEETGNFNLYLLEQTHYEDDGNGSVTWSGGVYISTDRGENWIDITGNLPVDLTRISQYDVSSKYYRALAYWFGIDESTAKSRFSKKPTSALSIFNRLVVDADDPNMIFLSHNWKHDYSFGPGDIWRTNDGGKTWIVAGRNGPYWRNQNDKTYWESRNNPLGINMKYAHLDHEMHYDGVAAGTRFMGGKCDGDLVIVHEQQVMRSKDHGDSWYQIDDDETAAGSGYWVGRGGSNLPGEGLVVETGMKRLLFLSGEHGLWISAPDGQNIIPEGQAVEQLTGQSKAQYDATSISAAAVHPKDTNTLYILMFRQSHRGYLRQSVDGGQTWQNIGYPVQYGGNLSSDHIFQYDLLIDQDDPDTMYFCVPTTKWYAHSGDCWRANGPEDYNEYGVFRSQDGGQNWALANNGLPANGSVYSLDMDPANPKILYTSLNKTITGQDGGLYRTSDGGDNWEEMNIPDGIESVNHLHVDRSNGTLYLSAGEKVGAIDNGGVWISKDKGLSWEKIFYMPNVNEAYSSNVNPEVIVVNVGRSNAASQNTGAFISMDAGQNWMKASYHIGQAGRMRALRPDPHNENIFWCSLSGSGFYKGVYTGSTVRALASNKSVYENEESSLDASASVGTGLSYHWNIPAGITLSSTSVPNPTFIAPGVEQDTTYKLMLTVTDGVGEDQLQVLLNVRNMVTRDAERVEEILISVHDLQMFQNEEIQLEAGVTPQGLAATVFWKSLDPGVASITPYGMLTAINIGNARIIASIGAVSDTLQVTVTEKQLTSLELSDEHIDLYIDSTYILGVSLAPEDAINKDLIWMSGDDAVATVDQFGVIHAHDLGSTIISVKNDASGLADTCTVTVSALSGVLENHEAVLQIYPNPAKDILYINWKGQLQEVSVYNLNGVLVLQARENKGNGKNKVHLESLPDGFYILKIIADKQLYTSSFIKE